MRTAVPWLAICLSLSVGCAGIQHTADYRSEVRHEALHASTSVTVLVSPKLREDREDEPERLEYVRQTLQSSLRRDLNENGPMGVDAPEAADARLVVVLTDLDYDENPIWIMTWFIAPLWLFGVPMNHTVVQLKMDVELTNIEGRSLYKATEQSKCVRYEGVYYGHETLTFGCPAQEMAEKVRDQLSLQRSIILGGIKRRRPDPVAQTLPPTTSVASGEIVAVFPIRDLSEQVDPKFITQLTEYLAVQAGQQLGFKVVPRQTIHAQLLDTKADSYRACYDAACQIELGRAVAAAKILSTSLLRAGDRCVFTATLYDLKTESADRAASTETNCANTGLLDGVRGVIAELGR